MTLLPVGMVLAASPSMLLAQSTASNKSPTLTKPVKPLPAANVARLCQRLAARLPGKAVRECKNTNWQMGNLSSRNALPLLISEQAGKEKQAVRILLLGGIHGDELTASAIVFEWMRWLSSSEAQDFHWKIAPVVNPDGVLAAKPSRVNAGGVDLNRNFPTPNWRQDSKRYWQQRTASDPRRFPGNNPLSEPESRWVNEQVERFKPHVIISVHAPFGVLDFDGPAPAPQRFGRLVFTPVGVYPGSLGNYIGRHKNLPVITIELPHAQEMPSDADMRRIWQDMLQWIRGNVSARPRKAGPIKSVAAKTMLPHTDTAPKR